MVRPDVSELAPPVAASLPPDQQPPPRGFDSLIVSDFPEIFDSFRAKRFMLLWRGSRDGFGAVDFHGRCDGHANTLTLILDTDGNVFGGFTPLKWESRVQREDWEDNSWNEKSECMDNRSKCDNSLLSFLFTLKNPHNIPARKFALMAEWKQEAIWCDSTYGPSFRDLGVRDNCNAEACSCTCRGSSYINDTGLHPYKALTGSRYFQVQEIEVFEITD
jgi:hypothetical protein